MEGVKRKVAALRLELDQKEDIIQDLERQISVKDDEIERVCLKRWKFKCNFQCDNSIFFHNLNEVLKAIYKAKLKTNEKMTIECCSMHRIG